MTLQEFIRDIVPVLQLGISALALISIFLLWWQLRQTTRWNKINTTLNVIDLSFCQQLEEEVLSSLMQIGIDLHHQITQEELRKMLGSSKANNAIKNYLSYLERLCTTVRLGVIDNDLAYHTNVCRVIHRFQQLEPYILYCRQRGQDDEVYIELEKVAKVWASRKAGTMEKQKVQVEAAKFKRGVAKKF